MSQAILISDSEVINSLYELNLRVYVAANVTIKRNLDSAIQLLEHSPDIDAIIVFKDLSSSSAEVAKFNDFLEEKKIKIPLILLGDQKLNLPNTIVIKNKYDIKSLLMGMAKILELTPEQMASREVPPYFPVPIRLLKNMESCHCDIFSRIESEDFEFEYKKLIEKNTELKDLLKPYIAKKEVTHLYIDSSERLRFINKASGFIVKELSSKSLSLDEKVEIVSQGQNMVAEELFEDEVISEAVAEVSIACIKAMNSIAKDVPKLRNLLAMLTENKSNFIFKHGVLATFIAREIINNISWGSNEQSEKVSFAIFFHDIFLVPVFRKYPDSFTEEDLLFRDDISPEDKELVLNHAKMAGDMIQTFPRAPMGADMIISQHHGVTNGRGFAVTYKDDISPLSKIIIIAEDAATGILKDISEGKKKEAVDMVRIMKRLEDRYSYSSYRKIIAALENIII